MEWLFWLLISVAVFYLIMRFAFGWRLVHGRKETFIDPVCGMEVDLDKGYGKKYQGREYWFCSRVCLDQFDAHPEHFLTDEKKENES